MIDISKVQGSHKYELATAEHDDLAKTWATLRCNPHADLEEFLTKAALSAQSLPSDLRRRILEFRRWGNHEGILLIRGLPTDTSLPETPADSRTSATKTTFVSESALAAVGSLLGEPFSYAQEKDGAIFQDVCPTRQNAEEWSSESSSILLPFHTEVAFHPFMPSYVLLYCLRGDRNNSARTMVASVRRVFPRLSEQMIRTLFAPIFETGIDYSFGVNSMTRGGGRVIPILTGRSDDPLFCFDPGLMTATGGASNAVLQELEFECNQAAGYVTLGPGDLMVIDNRRTVHARTAFKAYFDGNDRWLQRICVADSLVPSEGDRNPRSRVVSTTFGE